MYGCENECTCTCMHSCSSCSDNSIGDCLPLPHFLSPSFPPSFPSSFPPSFPFSFPPSLPPSLLPSLFPPSFPLSLLPYLSPLLPPPFLPLFLPPSLRGKPEAQVATTDMEDNMMLFYANTCTYNHEGTLIYPRETCVFPPPTSRIAG